jgi:hypothetical protein
MPTWNTVNNTIAQTANTIITVQDTLAGLGIEVSNICDLESIQDAVEKLLEDWWEDVNRSVDNISFEMVGNFLTTLAGLLAQLISAAAASYTNLFFIEILAGNLVNSIVSAIAFAMAMIPGAEIVLQYYLVSTLKRDLSRRRELGHILFKQVDMLIQLFNSFYDLFKLEDDLMYSDLKKALTNIRRAERIIGKEASKNFYGGDPVVIDGSGLVAADTYINKAINNLTHQNYDVVNNYIKSINAQYGITAEVPSGFDVQGWTNYFENIQPLVALNFFTYTAPQGTPEYENEVALKSARYAQFIAAMMKVMPPILQRIVLNATFKDASNVIFERIPVWANNISVLKELKNFLDNTVSVSDKFLNTYLHINRRPPTTEPDLFQNPATKDITWRNITSKVRIEEAGVLLFPSYWSYIQNVGGLLQNILLPTLNILKGVDTEIGGVLDSTERLGTSELSYRQFMWIEELSVARGMLGTVINSADIQNIYGGFQVNPIEVYNATVQADIYMGKLQEFIREKAFDSETQTVKTQAADTVYNTAQKYLGNLVQNIYIITNPAAAKGTISGLQAMKVALSQQMSLDRKESSLCNLFLNVVETNPLFIAAKPYLDKLLDDLAQTPIGAGIANQILTGDISGVISILEGYHLANSTANLINCENNETEQTVDPVTLGLDPDVTFADMKKIERAMSGLRDQQNMILDSIPTIIDKIENDLISTSEYA